MFVALRFIFLGILITVFGGFLVAVADKDFQDLRVIGIVILVAGIATVILGFVLWPRSRKAKRPEERPPAIRRAIPLSCPFCEHRIKVKSELAGHKIKCPECRESIAVPKQKSENGSRGRGLLSKDVNKLAEPLTNFDVRRFTLIGWLVFFISAAAGVTCFFPLRDYYDQLVGVPQANVNLAKHYLPLGLAVTLCGFAVFFLVMGLLRLLGIHAIRATIGSDTLDDE